MKRNVPLCDLLTQKSVRYLARMPMRAMWLALLLLPFLASHSSFAQCSSNCLTGSVSLNTGENPLGGLYSVPGIDGTWIIEAAPTAPTPRSANVVSADPSWPSPLGGSWFIGPDNGNGGLMAGVTRYKRCFRVCGNSGDVVNLHLSLTLMAANDGLIFFDGAPFGSFPGGMTATAFITNFIVPAGTTHCITVELHNPGGPTGLDLAGSVQTPAGAQLSSTLCSPETYFSSLRLFVFYDEDIDGTYDPEQDHLLSGITVVDQGPKGQTVAQSGSDGRVFLENVGSGEHNVSVIMPQGYGATVGGTYNVTLQAAQSMILVPTGMTPCSKICVGKFNDKNCNGVKDAGEPILGGWTILFSDGQTAVTLSTALKCVNVCTSSTITVSEVQQACWKQTAPAGGTFTITPIPGQQITIYFGNSSTGTLCVHKFNDVNANGVEDPGEPGLSGWSFTVTSATFSGTVTTGADGNGCINGVTCGTYKVCEVTKAGWCLTTPACVLTSVTPCSTTTVSFGNTTSGTICGTKYNDLNESGARDPGEPGLPNWEFHMTDDIGNVYVQFTDINGNYCFTLPAGHYVLTEVQQVPWMQTQPPDGIGYDLQITPCCFVGGFDFGNYLCSETTICVTKFNDINCDGIQEAGEDGIPNWRFTLTSGTTVITVTTGTAGVTCANLSTGGIWTVCEVTQAGWKVTTPKCVTIAVTTCQTVSVTFGNSTTGTICGTKYNDLNGDGTRDLATEPGLPNWEIHMTDDLGNVYVQFTDADGNYCFTLPAGHYVLTEVQQPGWTQNQPPDGLAYDLEITPCCFVGGFDFGNTGCVTTICVRKFNDKNCNGTQDPGEPNIPGWHFTLTSGSTSINVVTGSNGVTCATVVAGTWTVCEETRNCWKPTTSTCQTITIGECETAGLLFGNSSTGTICISKFNDINGNGTRDVGEPLIPNWPITIDGVPGFTTGPTGTFCTSATCGAHTICEVVLSGWTPTTPTCATVTVVPCATSSVTFGNRQCLPGKICVFKFNDKNCNGRQDPDESGIPGWHFTLTSPSATAITIITDANGSTCATVGLGTWTVCEEIRNCWVATTPTCATVDIGCDGSANLVFGNSSTGTICISKFNDINGNGAQDIGEPLIPNWPITIDGVPGFTTGPTGIFCTSATCGAHTICEVVLPGWTPTTPTCATVTVVPCQQKDVIFGNKQCPPGRICVFKFNDKNCNGTQDPGESGIPGWHFTLTSPSATAITIITDANGSTCATVGLGTWTVCEEIRNCWVATTPTCATVDIGCNGGAELVFGNSSTGTICISKFNDVNGNGAHDVGEPLIPNWPITIDGVPGFTTGPTGTFCTSATCGAHTICEVVLPGWTPTTPTCATVTVVPCQTVKPEFGNKQCQPGVICVRKFNDKNCNGTQDPGEPDIPGWKFTLTPVPSGTPITIITDASGTTCATVGVGGWTVCEETRSCWVATTPTCASVDITCGGTAYFPFGNSSTGTICISKFNDINGNGARDVGEPLIPNWPITIDGVPGFTTGPTGTFCTSATCGAHTICEVVLPGWTPTTPTCATVTVVPCQQKDVIFGNKQCPPGRICVFKFNDKNCNGTQDPGESGIPGWHFTLTSPSATAITIITDANGSTCATVGLGTWTVCEEIRNCWVATTPTCATVDIGCDGSANLVFGNSSTGTICISKFNDINGNGAQDVGEPLIPNWPITIDGVPGFTTGPTGKFCTSATCGTHTICEVVLPGWTPTTPTCATVTVVPCQQKDVIFGNKQCPPGRICVFKFNDKNCNGTQDPGESGIPGWHFTLTSPSATAITIITDANGSTCATVGLGTWTVCEEIRNCWVATTPTCATVDIGCDGSANLVFGNSSTGTICISKFNDINGNGAQDVGEPLIPNWPITIDGVPGFTTGPTGKFCTSATCGTHTICEVVLPGWTPTTPTCATVTVVPCQQKDVIFGNKQCPPGRICVFKFNDKNCNGTQDPGESGIPGWKFTLTPVPSGVPITIITDANGTTCATVGAGGWTVCEEIRSCWVATTPTCASVDMPPCGGGADFVFGNSSTGTICISKFNDLNGNGARDVGEPLIPNWPITIDGVPGFTTGPTGTFCTSATCGTHTICEVVLPGWTPTTPTCAIVTVVPCQTVKPEFGNRQCPPGRICVLKFNDKNCNGIQDPGEVGIAGWKFTLTPLPSGVPITIITDANGVTCATVAVGNWSVCEEIRNCWVATTPTCATVTIDCGVVAERVFGNSSTGTICISKFNDLNGNGARDVGEPLIPNWPITIDGVPGYTTGTTGTFCTSATCGVHTICEVVLPGWVATTPICVTVNTVPCQGKDIIFGNKRCPLGRICGMKFWDISCDSLRNGNDPGLPGWVIEIWDATGTILITTVTTDAAGNYCVDLVSPGTYIVREQMQPGWTQSFPTPVPPGEYTVTLGCGQIVTGKDFGNCRCTAKICGTKFWDKNCDRQREFDEPGLGGWVIQIWDATGTVLVTSVTTDALGNYCVDVPAPANYIVREQMQPFFFQSFPPTGEYNITVKCDDLIKGVDFGNCSECKATICGMKFWDKNCDHVHQPAEPGLGGWVIQIWDPTGTFIILTTITDAAGNYCVDVPAPASYIVREQLQPGWVQSFPPPGQYAVTLQCGQIITKRDFGNCSPCTARICGMKFFDVACDGQHQASDPGLGGWVIQVWNAAGTSVVLTATTDAAGNYCVDVPAPGSYIIREQMQPGWTQSFPPTPGEYHITVGCGQVVVGIDFGNCRCKQNCPAGQIHLISDPNQFSGWTTILTDPLVLPPHPRGATPLGYGPLLGVLPVGGAQWVGPSGPGINPPGIYHYQRKFCVCDPSGQNVVHIHIAFKGVDHVDFYINGVYIASYDFANPETVVDMMVPITGPCVSLDWYVRKYRVNPGAGAPTNAALTYEGFVNGPGVVSDDCLCCYERLDWWNGPSEALIMPPNQDSNNDDSRVSPGDHGVKELTSSVLENKEALNPTLKSVPNPTSGLTTIFYTMHTSTDMKLELYDALGRSIQTIEQGYRAVGSYNKQFDASQLPSGVYHVRMTIGGTVFTLQVVVQ